MDNRSLPPRSERLRSNRGKSDSLSPRESGRDERRSKRNREESQNSPKDWLIAIGVALLLAVLIRTFLAEPTSVSGRSMIQTLQPGDKVMINKIAYKLGEPERGDIVVFETKEGKDLIKRIIGLPGDKIQAKDGKVLLNGKPLTESYLEKGVVTEDFPETEVPSGKYFVMGDNRPESADSRNSLIGLVDENELIGKASFVYWPFSNIGSVSTE